MFVFIRAASHDDIDPLVTLNGEVQDLHAALFPEIFRDDWKRSELEAFWRSKVSEKDDCVLIAEAGDRVVGYIWMEFQHRPKDVFRHARRRIYIHHICVLANWRGKGIGRLLMAGADDYALQKDCTRIQLDVWHANHMARVVFERAEFVPLNLAMTRPVEESQL